MHTGYVELLNYWRDSLIDAERVDDELPEEVLEITSEELRAGKISKESLSEEAVKRLGLKVEEAEKPGNEQPARVLVCPVQLQGKAQHGQKKKKDRALLWIPADLTSELELRPRQGKYPWISRKLLEPALGEVADLTVGRLDDVEKFIQENSPEIACTDWQGLLEYGQKMLKAVVGNIKVSDYTIYNKAYVVSDDGVDNPAVHLIKLYDAIISDNRNVPLLEKYLSMTDEPVTAVMGLEQTLDQASKHCGQMTAKFPLAPSQREALHHFLTLKDGEILAVNGPPGTGKTTLLHSIIATLWVEAAFYQSEPPIIVAVSANNQAVTNIIDSFGKVLEHNPGNPLAERWLPEVKSYGLYFPAANLFNEANSRFQVASTNFYYFPANSGFPGKVEERGYLLAASDFFMKKFEQCFGAKPQSIDTALCILHRELEKCVLLIRESVGKKKEVLSRYKHVLDELDDIRKRFGLDGIDFKDLPGALGEHLKKVEARETELRNQIIEVEKSISVISIECEKWLNLDRAWRLHQKSEPFWWKLAWFLPVVKRRRQARLAAFVQYHGLEQANGEISYFISAGMQAALNSKELKKKEKLRLNEDSRQITAEKKNIETARESVLKLMPKLAEFEEEVKNLGSFLNDLDVTPRHKAFLLATHYWEARWLKEVELLHQLNESGRMPTGKERVERKLKLYAMLTPCMVSTLYILPKILSAPPPRSYSEQRIFPLYNFADLLIIDEAGQVLPNLAAPAFALARKAVVVGDLLQIEPVCKIPKPVDIGNLVRHEVIKQADDLDKKYDEIKAKGITVSSGCVMAIAQRACRYQKYDSNGNPYPERGMFLSEHYRCLDEIIDYCNRLAYGGRLEPKRGSEIPPGALPPFGYLHVPGQSRYVGGSRINEKEAEAILEWILAYKDYLEALYGRGEKQIYEIIAILTPFVAQKKLINNMLKLSRFAALRGGEKIITAGTVHALQGAERDVVVFSPVCIVRDGNPADFFFNKGKNMLNVAVSRAKNSFLVFGDLNVFKAGDSGLPSRLLGERLFSKPENNLSLWGSSFIKRL
ncbi:energy-coupling factor transporter ATP-binding protein EcfA2 [Desulfofundulus luciae]|uniref:Energy-coupling factor transporter ATP-binding protein EcfA2 n=1 Tax=Desulfofundulus luciae TaxID=74702 RepID=A0ABU0B657_9FIRM|nr:AAA domain-containing protein [Desulfofundulus luciae]MDQ0287740.1 energy-coupling factor transporter ATP-binding protein EcfA2 [Desulfofundulus luciae]